METELIGEIDAIGAPYDVDNSGGLSKAEMKTFLKEYGQEIYRQIKYL